MNNSLDIHELTEHYRTEKGMTDIKVRSPLSYLLSSGSTQQQKRLVFHIWCTDEIDWRVHCHHSTGEFRSLTFFWIWLIHQGKTQIVTTEDLSSLSERYKEAMDEATLLSTRFDHILLNVIIWENVIFFSEIESLLNDIRDRIGLIYAAAEAVRGMSSSFW